MFPLPFTYMITPHEQEEDDIESKYCNAKTMSPFRIEIETLTTCLNTANQYNNIEDAHIMLNQISNDILPSFSKSRVQAGTWIASPHLQFLPNQIVLLALSNAPIRCLAVIVKDHKDTAKDVIEGLKYSIMKIYKKKLKRETQPRLCFESLTNGKASGYLYTSRRGFYFVDKKSYDLKMTAVKDAKGDYQIRTEHAHEINDIFFTKVDGMHRRPEKGFRRVKDDIGMEQFLLNDYPTQEWKTHVNSLKDEAKDNEKGRFYYSPEPVESLEPATKKQKRSDEPIASCVGRFGDTEALFDKGFNRYTRLTDSSICNYDPKNADNKDFNPYLDDDFWMGLRL